jgi:DNA topoisomerase VI subunit B
MFERQDWGLFRTIDGLSSKAGVPREMIASLVAKELMDNALDESESCEVRLLDDHAGFFVQDNGPGLDPAQVANLFSIKRPLKSTKFLRLPSRGALGAGRCPKPQIQPGV